MKKLMLLLILFLLTGCWNYQELNSLAIATGFAIDIVDSEYEVTVLISNSQKESSSEAKSSASSAVYKGRGKTIEEAIKDSSMAISKQIYVSHIEVLVLSEEVAKNKTLEVVDFFFRYPQTRNEFFVVVAEDCKAGDTFLVTTPLETFPSQNISKNLEVTSKLQGYIYTVTFNDFIKNLIEEGVSPVLPTISIIGNIEEGNKDKNIEQNEPNTYLKLGMMGIFKKDKFIDISNKEQSQGINFLNDEVITTLIRTEQDDGFVVVELNDSTTKIDVEIKNIPKYKVIIKATGTITEVSDNIDIEEDEIIEQIKNSSVEEIKKYCIEGLDYAKKLKTDIFGFGNLVYKKDHKLWDKIKDKWEEEIFNQVEVEFDIKLDLKTKGSIDDSIEVR
ncbi:MAG: Ger(x)C family spore germination protein [Firmicutes bacterium]|nr:Ger(x)C family spore germination protein [Bacillota bacterium]